MGEVLRMNKREGAIITAYTGYLCCDASSFHKYAEEILNSPIFTHEFANEGICMKLQEASKKDFFNLMSNLKD